MRRFFYRLLPLTLFVLLISLPMSHVVLADEGDYTCTYDFTIDEQGWIIVPFNTYLSGYGGGSYDTGVGFVSEHIPDFSELYISRIFDAPVDSILNFQLTAVFDNNHNPTTGNTGAQLLSSGSAEDVDVSTDSLTIANVSGEQVFDFPRVPVTTGRVSYRYRMWDTVYDEYHFTKVVITGNGTMPDATYCVGGGPTPGTLTRPLTSADEVAEIPLYDTLKLANLPQAFTHEFNVYDVLHTGGPETVHAWSNAPGAPVHAADAGSVASVKPLSWDECGIGQYWPHIEGAEITGADFYDFPASSEQPCIVELYDTSVIGELADVPWPDYTDESSVYKHRYWLDASDVYIVTLQIGESQKIRYLVKNAPNYVIQGDTVEAGCVLGETIPLTAIPTQALNFPKLAATAAAVSFASGGTLSFVAGAAAVIAGLANVFIPAPTPDTTTFGYTTVSLYDVDDSILELASQLTVEPTSDDKCLGTGQYSNCTLDNPTFSSDGNTWVAGGNVEWLNPGVQLDPLEQVSTTLNLDPEADYTVTAFAEGVNGQVSQIRIWLGNNTERVDVPVEWTSLQLTTSPVGDADQGLYYSVGIQNTGSQPIEVHSLCVTDGAPNLGPNSCYFNNQSFVEGISGWTVSEGVEESDQALNVPDNGVISQNVMLNPLSGGPATYKLVVRGDWWYTGALDTTSSASAIASVKYEYPDGTGYQDMVPINITGNLAFGAGQLAYIANIEVSSPTDDLMNIKVETTDAGDMGVQGIRITDACLSTIDGGGFPGQQGDSAPPPIDANCTYVSRPQNNDPAAWLQWHWAMSGQFFTCKLMVLLNKMYVLGQQSYTLAGWQARYAQSTMRMWSSWLGSQFFPWLNGQFRNIAIGQVTTVYQSGGACNDIFCVLNTLISGVLTPINNIVNTLLGLITTAANLFLTVLTGIIGLGLAFLIRIFGLFNQIISLFVGIISAYSTATPATIEGLPICGMDPTSSPFCRAVWVLDNTILGGRWGALFVIVLGIASVHLVLWVIGEFKSAIVNAGVSA